MSVLDMNVRYEFPMRPILTCFTLKRRLLDVGLIMGPMELGLGLIFIGGADSGSVFPLRALRYTRPHDVGASGAER